MGQRKPFPASRQSPRADQRAGNLTALSDSCKAQNWAENPRRKRWCLHDLERVLSQIRARMPTPQMPTSPPRGPSGSRRRTRLRAKGQGLASSYSFPNSPESTVAQRGHAITRPLRGKVEVKFTRVRSKRTTRSSEISSRQAGQRTSLSRAYAASESAPSISSGSAIIFTLPQEERSAGIAPGRKNARRRQIRRTCHLSVISISIHANRRRRKTPIDHERSSVERSKRIASLGNEPDPLEVTRLVVDPGHRRSDPTGVFAGRPLRSHERLDICAIVVTG